MADRALFFLVDDFGAEKHLVRKEALPFLRVVLDEVEAKCCPTARVVPLKTCDGKLGSLQRAPCLVERAVFEQGKGMQVLVLYDKGLLQAPEPFCVRLITCYYGVVLERCKHLAQRSRLGLRHGYRAPHVTGPHPCHP